jgi:hypothetical protein
MTWLTQLASAGISLLTLNLTVFAVGALDTYAQSSPTTTFRDVPSNYWAQPFIQGLAARNIVAGYPDGTFRPEQSVNRDEFAALIRQAFNQPPIRQIESGAVYQDIPADHWAIRPIEEAYEQGFMTADPSGYFRPNQPVSKVEAIVALNKGLNLTANVPVATEPTVTQRSGPQPTTRRITKKPIFFPLAVTSLMQPLLIPQAQAAPVKVPTPAAPLTTEQKATEVSKPASLIVSKTYEDANKIPQNAVDSVAAATKRNIVVNHPNPQILNPNKPVTRGEITALVYQTLVAQNKIEPLADNLPANRYIVRIPLNNQNGQ